jgi:hypothetical protein
MFGNRLSLDTTQTFQTARRPVSLCRAICYEFVSFGLRKYSKQRDNSGGLQLPDHRNEFDGRIPLRRHDDDYYAIGRVTLMNRTLSTTLLLLALLDHRLSHAQALPTATAPGAYVSVGGGVSIFDSGYGKQRVGGTSLYVDINPVRAIGIEAEGRWMQENSGPKITESTYLVGPRIQLRRGPFTPYFKTLVGLAHFTYPYKDARGEYFVIAPGAGIDLMLGQNFKIRLLDIEYQEWPQFTFGAISPYGVSCGISFRVFNGSR